MRRRGRGAAVLAVLLTVAVAPRGCGEREGTGTLDDHPGGHRGHPRSARRPAVPGRQRVHVRDRADAARPLRPVRHPDHRRHVRGEAGHRGAQGRLRHRHRRPRLLRHQRGRLLHVVLRAQPAPPVRPRLLRPAGPRAVRWAHLPAGRGHLLPDGLPDPYAGPGAGLRDGRPPLQHRLPGRGRTHRPAALPRHGAGRRGPGVLPPAPAGRPVVALRRVVRDAALPDLRRRPPGSPRWAGARRHRRPDPGRAGVLRAAGPRLQRRARRDHGRLRRGRDLRGGRRRRRHRRVRPPGRSPRPRSAPDRVPAGRRDHRAARLPPDRPGDRRGRAGLLPGRPDAAAAGDGGRRSRRPRSRWPGCSTRTSASTRRPRRSSPTRRTPTPSTTASSARTTRTSPARRTSGPTAYLRAGDAVEASVPRLASIFYGDLPCPFWPQPARTRPVRRPSWRTACPPWCSGPTPTPPRPTATACPCSAAWPTATS